MNRNILFILLLSIVFYSSCEDVIEVDLEPGENQLVVDAWITNLPETQTITLTRTIPYFQASNPPAETGATVQVIEDNGTVYNFEDADNNGTYTWTPEAGESFGQVDGNYGLSIVTADGLEYVSASSMKRIMPIDSIVLEDREDEEFGQVAGIYAELFARDFSGEGDAYWIKTYKNGAFLNKPQEMNLVWDAAFTPGSGVDGVIFITPIRQNINRIPDSGDDAVDDSDTPPWALGDSINIEIHSLNPESFLFLEQAFTQMTLGDAGIFAEPPANVPSNIVTVNSEESADQAIGFFNVSAVSSMGKLIEF